MADFEMLYIYRTEDFHFVLAYLALKSLPFRFRYVQMIHYISPQDEEENSKINLKFLLNFYIKISFKLNLLNFLVNL